MDHSKRRNKTKRYDKLLIKIVNITKGLCNTKVSTDTKRILRLPSTIQCKYEMYDNK